MNRFLTTMALAALTLIPMPACDGEEADNAADDDAFECPAPVLAAPAAPPRVVFLAPPEGVDLRPREIVDGEVVFREQGPPAGLYTSKLDGKPIHRQQVAKLVLSAEGQEDPNETCTLSWYQPDLTQPYMVLGLGCSMMAPIPLWDFYRSIFEKNGATKF